MAPAHTVRWGLLSPGRIAHQFADALSAVSDAQLVAVAGRDFARAKAFTERWPSLGAEPLANMQALLAREDIAAVYIASPHSEHAVACAAALRAGKHVLCEKPLVPSAAQARELIELAEQQQRLLMEALWTRFLPGMGVVREWLVSGAIGRLRSVQASFCFDAPFEPEGRIYNPALAGGALLDIGIYCISLAQWAVAAVAAVGAVSDAHVVHAQAQGECAPTGVDQRVHAQLRFAGGQTAQFLCAFDGHAPNDLVLLGTQGCIRIEAPFWHAPAVRLLRPGQADELRPTPPRRNGFEYQIEEAQACMRAGRIESPGITHAETLAALELIDTLRAQLGVRYPFEA